MRKRIVANWVAFDFWDFPEDQFSVLRDEIFKKNLNTNQALFIHLIDLECFLKNFKSEIFEEKLFFLKNNLNVDNNINLMKKLFDLNLKRFNLKKKKIWKNKKEAK